MATTATIVNKQLKVFEVFRSLDIHMPVDQIVFFLVAAKNEGLSLREIAEQAGVNANTASRYLANLSDLNRFKQPGLKLLEAYDNPMNRRMKIIKLTEDGKKVIESLT